MQLIRYHPSAPLNTYVECLWWSQRDEPEAFGEHMLPSGNAQVIFALHDAPIICLPSSSSQNSLAGSRGVVHGPQWRYYRSGPKPAGVTAGIALRPGAGEAVLGIPIAELTDRHVATEALWGARARDLREELLAAREASGVFRILERDLRNRLKSPLIVHPAVARALTFPTDGRATRRVANIQREAGYSPRHFIALFRAAVGLTPKHHFRVQRFTHVLRYLARGSGERLADLAASAGYSDQAHLTREFREFAGITPTQYRPRDPNSALHHRAEGNKSSRPG